MESKKRGLVFVNLAVVAVVVGGCSSAETPVRSSMNTPLPAPHIDNEPTQAQAVSAADVVPPGDEDPLRPMTAADEVASDQVGTWFIVRDSGSSKAEKCVQLEFVVQAYLQARDTENYRYWQDIKHDKYLCR
jgi:hypothetical protein